MFSSLYFIEIKWWVLTHLTLQHKIKQRCVIVIQKEREPYYRGFPTLMELLQHNTIFVERKGEENNSLLVIFS